MVGISVKSIRTFYKASGLRGSQKIELLCKTISVTYTKITTKKTTRDSFTILLIHVYQPKLLWLEITSKEHQNR